MGLSVEEHKVAAPNQMKKRSLWLRAIITIASMLQKVVSFIFCSLSKHAHAQNTTDLTERLLAPSETGDQFDSGGKGDAYERVFQCKIMCLESMRLPQVLIERYRNEHDPYVVSVVDKAVNEMHACRASMAVLKYATDCKSDDIMQASTVLWKERMHQHNSIIQLNMNRLVDALSKRKKDTLVQMVEASAQSAAESQSRQALIDLNKTMLSASQADSTVENSNRCQVVTLTPTVSAEHINKQQQAIAKQTRSQSPLLA